MKKLFFTILLFCPLTIIFSQNLKMGLYIAPTINSINTNDFGHEQRKVGFNYGYSIEYQITENHSLESGFEISKKSGQIQTINYKSHYLEIPLKVKMKSRPFGYLTYFAKTGPSLGIKLRDNVEGGSQISVNDLSEAKTFMMMLNISIGAEYSLKQESTIYSELFIKNGITQGWKNTNTISYETFLMNQFGLRLGFLF